jgi:hypothetical protein
MFRISEKDWKVLRRRLAQRESGGNGAIAQLSAKLSKGIGGGSPFDSEPRSYQEPVPVSSRQKEIPFGEPREARPLEATIRTEKKKEYYSLRGIPLGRTRVILATDAKEHAW